MKKNETMPGVCCLLKNKGPQSITLGIPRERGVRGGGSEKRRKEEVPVEDRQEEKKGPEPETEIPLSMRGSSSWNLYGSALGGDDDEWMDYDNDDLMSAPSVCGAFGGVGP